jgi:hypothetical protein
MGMRDIKIMRMLPRSILPGMNALELLSWGDPSKCTEIKRAIYTSYKIPGN